MNTEPLTDEELMRVATDPYTVSVKTIRRLATELQAARLAHRWRPIADAPKDGTEILIINPGSCIGATLGIWAPFEDEGKMWRSAWDHEAIAMQPTHWMPLPSAPERSQP